MIITMKRVVYKGFGYRIISDFPLPELLRCEQENQVDVFIKKVDLTELWLKNAKQYDLFVVTEDMVMFQVPDTGIFCIRAGESITISPADGYDVDKLRLYILGTCMGVLLLQRKILPLHGSAVSIDGKAYAIVGHSGAGKSTLAAVFINKGYQLLSDDVIAVSICNRCPVVIPSYPQQKLWQESIHKLGMDNENFLPLFERENKFAVPIKTHFHRDPLPLAGVIELVKSDDQSNEIRHLQGMDRFHLLFRHTYRNFLIERCGLMEWHFNMLAGLMKKINVMLLNRSTSSYTAPHLASLILNEINKQGGSGYDYTHKNFIN